MKQLAGRFLATAGLVVAMAQPAVARPGASSVAAEVPAAGEPRRTEPVRSAAAAYAEDLAHLRAHRRRLADLRSTVAPPDEAEVLDQATRLLEQALVVELLPRWLGVRWGSESTELAWTPLAPGAAVNCSSFVVAVLASAGFRFFDRDLLAQAPALRLLEALMPDGEIAHWQGSVGALERELLHRGDGVYLLGLSRHIGFVVVVGTNVRLVHASRGAGQVVSEPLATAAAILRSRRGGVYLGALLSSGHGQGVIRRWLDGGKLGPS